MFRPVRRFRLHQIDFGVDAGGKIVGTSAVLRPPAKRVLADYGKAVRRALPVRFV